MYESDNNSETIIRVITRKSQLAVAQTNAVLQKMKEFHSNLVFEIKTIETVGDKNLDQALPLIGGKGLFTQELENALIDGSADIAVHSLKDLPLELPTGLQIGAILSRENPSDAVLFRDPCKHKSLEDLAPQSIVGTSSLRRKYTIQSLYPDLQVTNIRGNLQTRLMKLKGKHPTSSTHYDAILLAVAGLNRSDINDYYETLSDQKFMHAAGQGFLAIECRINDPIIRFMKCLQNTETDALSGAERGILRFIGGGCHTPLSVFTSIEDGNLFIKATLFNEDGTAQSTQEALGALSEIDSMVPKLAYRMKSEL
uniref:hydroxymethylbilane synthase n=1 Tax=Perkinsela sp. SMB-60 TaxID=1840652 RepID=A0A167HCV1_9EUGL|nr:hydroxymethylbilane synthase/porphobilinogen deaminase [Perkinsela sp. SMB-60]